MVADSSKRSSTSSTSISHSLASTLETAWPSRTATEFIMRASLLSCKLLQLQRRHLCFRSYSSPIAASLSKVWETSLSFQRIMRTSACRFSIYLTMSWALRRLALSSVWFHIWSLSTCPTQRWAKKELSSLLFNLKLHKRWIRSTFCAC